MENISDLIKLIVSSLVDNPDEIHITEVKGDSTTVYELKVAKDDLGKIIGKQGKTCLLYTSPSPRDLVISRMPSSA